MNFEWFKKEEGMEDLKQIITASTSERSKEIDDHVLSTKEYVIEKAKLIIWQIEEIDTKIQVQLSSENNHSLHQIKLELEDTMKKLSSELGIYAESNPVFQKEVQKYEMVCKGLENIVNSMDNNGSISDKLVSEWNEQKDILLKELETINQEIEKSENDEATFPPVYN